MFNILTLNKISKNGLDRLDSALFTCGDAIENPDAILVRSASMHEYELSENGSLIMGERRKEDGIITGLTNDVPIIITAVVWLDGDNIYNSNAAISNQSMTGTLNLQFASSAELNPANIAVNIKE